ncbi:hypothetical protein [Marinomonas mediterranea]|jgi:hypothetical protein|uniref:Uncharacterized protein n=1 Tax=Marinomonas mediterranea (strain ATCC 700492 / JCM 21426 / NBRC 103028 / MMB-1) TaxID=717774 RepID=F2JVG0_MARM1|nr:hypothetical protein [Marinomonas mediterranea]ADZ89418.1 hypothetical protein Marme_0112 [Marinomonas mediterranea MMB-1]WCN15676.1 hypothetical protein GV053_00550 [Marinomonas mediterranea MMB-1]
MKPSASALFMRVVAILFAAYALLWATAPFTAINLPARLILDVSDWPLDRLSQPLDRNTMWIVSIAAGLLGAIAVLFWRVVAPAIEAGNKAIMRSTLYAILVWYVIDGIGSVASGVVSNLVFNTVYLVLVIAPLILTKYGREGSV